jgi:hypothetical protein
MAREEEEEEEREKNIRKSRRRVALVTAQKTDATARGSTEVTRAAILLVC